MPANSHKPDELTDPPPRFGMRAVLVTMTVLALLVAGLTPVLRAWELEHWQTFGSGVFFTVAGTSAMCFLGQWKTRRVERRAGRPLIWLVRDASQDDCDVTSLESDMLGEFMLGALGMLAAVALMVSSLRHAGAARAVWPTSISFFNMGGMMGLSLWLLLRRRLLRGVALGPGGVFLPTAKHCFKWDNVTVTTDPEGSDEIELTLQHWGGYSECVHAFVPEHLKPAVTALLAEKAPR